MIERVCVLRSFEATTLVEGIYNIVCVCVFVCVCVCVWHTLMIFTISHRHAVSLQHSMTQLARPMIITHLTISKC